MLTKLSKKAFFNLKDAFPNKTGRELVKLVNTYLLDENGPIDLEDNEEEQVVIGEKEFSVVVETNKNNIGKIFLIKQLFENEK